MPPIFSQDFLADSLLDFNLSTITDVRAKILILKSLIEELETGKLQSLKEEEIKSRFLNQFFGDVLGFNYGNSEHWMLREEKKSTIDGTKPDAVLGYFSIDKNKDDARVVIEIKDAKTNLDEKQNRSNNATPIEQAFGYVSKMGGSCKWVIISNVKEIRFYPSLDRSKYQLFLLKDLGDEAKLKELFFLFHKDRFIKQNTLSPTEMLFERSKIIQAKDIKPIHIIDDIHYSLKRFEGLGFIDPNYIATIKPFNILKEHVWHYHDGNLMTLNSEIFYLLQEIQIENDELVLSIELQKEIAEANVIDSKDKLEWIFTFLNYCEIEEISAVKDYKLISARNNNIIGFSYRHHFGFKDAEGITKKITIDNNKTCDCLSCNYRTLDFDKMLNKLKTGFENDNHTDIEYAYGNYLVATNNFKTTYKIYKTIEKEIKGRQGKAVQYFLVKKNIKYLHNLILDYRYADSVEILDDIKSVDLDKIIYDEIEFEVDKDVKDYLIKIKDDDIVYKLKDEIDDILIKIKKLKLLYENGDNQIAGPNLSHNLSQKYHLLYLYVNRNYFIYDIFKTYKSISEKVFKGLVDMHYIPEVGLKLVDEFFLSEAILHIGMNELRAILKDVNEIKVSEDCIVKLLDKLNNFTKSYYKEGFLNTRYVNTLVSEQLNNYKFEQKFTQIFSNLFTVLSRLDIDKSKFENVKYSLIKYLEIEKELAWFHLGEFSNFIGRKGYLFESDDLIALLKQMIKEDSYEFTKYKDIMKQVARSLNKFHPFVKISNKKLVQTAILNCWSESGQEANFMHIVDLVNACDEPCQQIFYDAFKEYLDRKFNYELYEYILLNTNLDFKGEEYFQQYLESLNKIRKGGRVHKFGKGELTDIVFINFILLIYYLEIKLTSQELKVFENLNDFEMWLLNPTDFDYSKFDAKWLIDIRGTVIISKLISIAAIAEAMEVELKKEFNPVLAEIKYKYYS